MILRSGSILGYLLSYFFSFRNWIELDGKIPELPDPMTKQTEWLKYVRMRSDLLSDFWGTDIYLGAWVLLPAGFDEHPDARYPVAIFHGHFPAEFGNFRPEPPEEDLPCTYSARFRLDCYNRVQQEYAHQLFNDWTSPPRLITTRTDCWTCTYVAT